MLDCIDQEITTTITDRNVKYFRWRNVDLKLFDWGCKFTPKGVAAQLSPLLVLTYTHSLLEMFLSQQ